MLGQNAAVPILVLFVTGAAAVPLGSMGYDLLRADADALADEAEEAVHRTLHDLSRLPLTIDQAHGGTQNGAVTSVMLLVRATDRVALGDLVITEDGAVRAWSVTDVLRDRDDSAARGELNRGDLVRVHVDLPAPWAAGSEGSLVVHGDAPAETWTLGVPHNTSPARVELRFLP